MTSPTTSRFHELHARGQVFVMPNPWDGGWARMLANLGFPALATTSSGFATSLGRDDGAVTLEELVAHVAELLTAVDVPINVDSERCFAETAEEIGRVVAQLAAAGSAGFSIEDWDPKAATIDDLDVAVERVAAAVEAAQASEMVVTARAENHLRGGTDLDDTIERLVAFAGAGAQCVYAPGLANIDDIARVVKAVDVAVNVLALPLGPNVAQLGATGIRRVSTGGALARAACGSMLDGARELLAYGTSTCVSSAPNSEVLSALTKRD